jgi:hypothetical protein
MQLEEWRALRTQGEAATLPSELEVRLKRVSAFDLAAQGRIPQELHPQLNRLIGQGAGAGKNVTIEEFAEFAELINVVCAACIVAPEDLDVTELTYNDRLSVFMWANEVSGKLKPFRGAEAEPVDTAFAVGDVRPAAKRVSGTRA